MPGHPRSPDLIPLPAALATGKLYVGGSWDGFPQWARENQAAGGKRSCTMLCKSSGETPSSMATSLDMQVSVPAFSPPEVTLAVNAWWQDVYDWFPPLERRGAKTARGSVSQVSQVAPPFHVVWVNFQYKSSQRAELGGENLPPERRLEVALKAIAKALHAGETVIIFCKRGVHRTGALAILVTCRALLLCFGEQWS